MTPAEGITKLGFRRWYERELVEGHVYLVTCVLSLMLTAVCLEQLDWRGPLVQFAFTLTALVLGGVLCIRALQRYNFLLARAECFGGQSVCRGCAVYGVLNVIDAGTSGREASPLSLADNTWVRVRCKRCGHEWRIDNR